MKSLLRNVVLVASLSGVAACSFAPQPKSIVQTPTSVRPSHVTAAAPQDGSIYREATGYRPIFEDVRARMVGDTLTINLNENTAATKNADTSASHTGGTSFGVPTVIGLPVKSLQGATLSANSATTFEGKGASTANNTMTGSITVTVIGVLANGNLEVSGEKRLALNQGEEFVRFSGVVSPSVIAAGNTVSSTQVADARIEYRGKGYIDEAQTMGWLSRFFMSVLPF